MFKGFLKNWTMKIFFGAIIMCFSLIFITAIIIFAGLVGLNGLFGLLILALISWVIGHFAIGEKR